MILSISKGDRNTKNQINGEVEYEAVGINDKAPNCQYSDITSAEKHHRRQFPMQHKRVLVVVVAAAATTSTLEGLLRVRFANLLLCPSESFPP